MRLHWLEHAALDGPGCIAPWVEQNGHRSSASRLHHGDALPTLEDFDGLIVLGGPMNIYQEADFPWLVAEKRLIRAAIDADKKVLGICFGAQLIADVLGGPVRRNAQLEIGWFPVQLTKEGIESPFLDGIDACFDAFHWHGDTYVLPPGAVRLAASAACAQQAFSYGQHVLGLQFHLEVRQREIAAWAAKVPPATPTVQSADEMLADDGFCAGNTHRMERVLELLFGCG